MIENVSHFDITRTFECGQCFRWQREEDGSYTGIVDGHATHIAYDKNTVYIDSTFNNLEFWMTYLDLNRDYAQIEAVLSKDLVMKNAITAGSGIRLLKQPAWECLISFILSQNNNIPRIKRIVHALCTNFGDRVSFRNQTFYTFPKPEQLHQVDLSPIRAGFRAKYLQDAVNQVITGEIDLSLIWKMTSCEAQAYLKNIKGVGDKVADCILLFAYQKFDVFPKDVWIKRIVSNLYHINENEIADFARNQFNQYCGFAQQYLFYHARG